MGQENVSGGESQLQQQTTPLRITIIADSATRQYAEQSAETTVAALRADILQGKITKEARTRFEIKDGDAKPRTIEGTLIQCSARYPQLADLYTPVSRLAHSGMRYGIGVGIFVNFILLGILVSRTNQTFGLAIMGMSVCFVIAVSLVSFKVNLPAVQTPCMLAAVILPAYLGFNGLFPQVLGAALSGGVLGFMPGMTVGAIVGVIRRPQIPKAADALPENAALRIAVPLVVSVAIWASYLTLARELLPELMK